MMKVAVSAKGTTLDAVVDPLFGRAENFVVVETDTMTCRSVANENKARSGGAGIQSAQMLAHAGARVVLTGNCGPNAHRTLQAAGIDVVVGCTGTVGEIIERFKAGDLRSASAPNVESHAGMSGRRVR